ncbi:MAG: signal recognition particle protein [Epsilonproteobacteria bacterium]|nr:signal recognition particle protein [Campylobacterota bacterium]
MFDFLSQKFSGVLSWLKDKGRLSEENIAQATKQIEEALLEADVPFDIVKEFLNQVKGEIVGQKVTKSLNPGQQMIKIVHQKLLDFLGGAKALSPTSFQIPSVLMVMGLQGSGKTTTIAKLTHWIKKQAKQRGKQRAVLLASVDFYRPAAIDQLEILAKQVDTDFYRAQSTDPVSAAREIYDHFKKNQYEHLFLDTAGRLHIDQQLMEELKQINAKLTPRYKILVLDAMTGQESLNIAKSFNDEIGFDSVILSKMDSDTRGGAAFAFRYALKKPIAFVGSGEKIDDLEHFIPERMTTRILGMGDIMTLIEKASEDIDEQKQENLSKKLFSGNFSLNEFLDQIQMIDKLGSLQKITRYLPGFHSLPQDAMEKGQTEIKKFKAIICSMTPKERLAPAIFDASRKKRVAQGAGVQVQDINQLLERFEQSKQFVRMFKRSGKFGKFFTVAALTICSMLV